MSAPSHYLTERPPPALVRGSGATVTILVSAADSGDAVGVIETVFPPGDGVLGTLVLRGIDDSREADREVVALSGRIGRPALVMLVSALPASVYAVLERAIPPVGSGDGFITLINWLCI